MNLTSDDYENIWLRIKDKFLKWFGYILIATSTVAVFFGGYIGHEISKNMIESFVKDYTSSEEFKLKIISSVTEKLPQASNRIEEINQQLIVIDKEIENQLSFLKT